MTIEQAGGLSADLRGFMNPSLPGGLTRRITAGYEEQAAENAWTGMLSFLAQHLGSAAQA